MRSSAATDELVRDILRYLIEHPEAKDTLDGIVGWWLPRDFQIDRTAVEKALVFLVSKKWLCRIEIQPAQTLYNLNKQFLDDIGTFLETSR